MQESSPSLTPVSPVKPVAPYIGGKRNLSGRLCKQIAAMRERLIGLLSIALMLALLGWPLWNWLR